MQEPVKIASDIQSSVSIAECEHLAKAAEGKVVLEIGSGAGRLTIALASNAQRVHSVDDHGGDSPFANTLSEFVNNLKRYRVVDKVVMHIGPMDKSILALDKSIFHAAIVVGPKGKRLMGNNPGFFAHLLKNGKAVYVHGEQPPDATAITERLFQLSAAEKVTK